MFECTCNTQTSFLLNQHNGDDAPQEIVVYFKKEYNARLLVLGLVGALIYLVDKVALTQWVLIVLLFPSVSIPPTVVPYSLTFPADTLGPPLYASVLQQTV